MGMSLTVDRLRLLEQLRTRRDEINAYYDGERTKLQAALDSLNTSAKAWAEYHRLISEGLTKGDYTYDNGRIRSTVPASAGQRKSPDDTHVPLPDKPGSRTTSFGPRQHIETNLEQLDSHYRAHDLRPYESAIAILELSDDDKITIEGSDYDRLLSRSVGRNFDWQY